MDERILVEEVLGLELGDAHVFRNAGGKVTDDIEEACQAQVEYFREHPLIPDETTIHGSSTRLKATLCDIQVNAS